MTVNVKILEGTRGVGKSTVARLLRDSIEGSTLINLTGFQADGVDGLKKIENYYVALVHYLTILDDRDEEYCVIFDRIFFSEMAYSPLYKSYDFTKSYHWLCERLADLTSVEIYFLTIGNKEELQQRLLRDKVELFGNVEETADQSILQQIEYTKLFIAYLKEHHQHSNFKFLNIDTAAYTPQEIRNIILKE